MAVLKWLVVVVVIGLILVGALIQVRGLVDPPPRASGPGHTVHPLPVTAVTGNGFGSVAGAVWFPCVDGDTIYRRTSPFL